MHIKPFVYDSLNTRALHFGIGEIQSRMQLSDPTALDLEYTCTMMGFLLFNPQPQRLVMIGLGGGSLAKFCHRHLPHTQLHVVEINPHVIALRDEFHIPPDDERFSVQLADGAQFVREPGPPCDVLLVDGYDLGGLAAALSTQAFYDDCFNRLQPQGLMVVNLHQGDVQFDIILDRIQRAFGQAVLVVDGADLSNSIVFARRGAPFEAFRGGLVRRPAQMDPAAACQLMAGFALISAALKDQAGGHQTPFQPSR